MVVQGKAHYACRYRQRVRRKGLRRSAEALLAYKTPKGSA
jgi:hypothetical protein